MTARQHIFIYGLARSGTSIFWSCFRKDPRFLCFDEPFAPDLHLRCRGGVAAMRPSQNEFLSDHVKRIVHGEWSTIQPTEQTWHSLQNHQDGYIQSLLSCGGHVCIKAMGCHAKIRTMKAVLRDALHVLVIRDPRGWVTSHVNPGGSFLSEGADPDRFFHEARLVVGDGDTWEYGRLARLYGINEELAVPALTELWYRANKQAIEQDPDLIIFHEVFAHSPRGIMSMIYEVMNIESPDLDYSEVRKPTLGFEPGHVAWIDARNKLEEITKMVMDSALEKL